MQQNRKFLFFGGGAIGSLYGSRFFEGGSDVYVICRSNYTDVLNNGYEITSVVHGNYTFRPTKVYCSIKEACSDNVSFDYLVISTKALPNLVDLPALVAPIVDANPMITIVLLQNGIRIEHPYRTAFPNIPILTCVSYIAVDQTSPGKIYHKNTSTIYHGLYDTGNSSPSDNTDALEKQEIFHQCAINGGINSIMHPNIQGVRWLKLCWNASFNPLAVLAGCLNSHQLLAIPEMKMLLLDTVTEVYNLGKCVTGAPLPTVFNHCSPETIISVTEKLPDPVNPSMMLDYMNGRPMEHVVILKNTIECADSLSIPVPNLKCIYPIILALDSKRKQ